MSGFGICDLPDEAFQSQQVSQKESPFWIFGTGRYGQVANAEAWLKLGDDEQLPLSGNGHQLHRAQGPYAQAC